jgi:hypothetical protein
MGMEKMVYGRGDESVSIGKGNNLRKEGEWEENVHTATNVPGKNTIVTTAMVFITPLSFLFS